MENRTGLITYQKEGRIFMKKQKIVSWIVAIVVVLALMIAGTKLYQLMFGGAVKVQTADVISAIAQMKVQLIIGAVILIAGIVIFMIGCRKKEEGTKHLVKVQGGVAMILALVITVNMVCFGPQYSNLTTVLSGTTEISAEHAAQSLETAEAIADEGITLLKNEDKALPLAEGTKLNVFGWSSVAPIYGGAGSGSSDSSNAATLLDGLHEAGFETNSVIEDFYTNFRAERPSISFFGVDFTVPEPTMEEYQSAGIFENAKEFSDTALVVIGRSSGEGSDLAMNLSDDNNFTIGENGEHVTFSTQEDDLDGEKSYLELSNREVAMLGEVTKDFQNVVVVINSAQPMELGWLDQYDNIKGAIYCPSPGQVGFRSLGKILSGEVNPSARLVDTFVYDLHEIPTIHNFGSFHYTDYEDVTGSADNIVPFVNYNEGIYVGYKFYETAAAEGLINYDEVVQYPFGYGLSYTNFDSKITDTQDDGEKITLTVEVTNTGDVAGKYVPQIYYNPPYTDGGIEKATANLIGYEKTGMIEPGESENVTFEIDYEDMASYDSDRIKTADGAYVLEAGDYQINLCSDSHHVVDTYTATVDTDRIYDDAHDGKRSSDEQAATNQLDYAKGDVTYLSRAGHFANYEEAVAGPTDFVMPQEAKDNYASVVTFDASKYDAEAQMPVTGADNSLKIQDMAGVDYDDEKWDSLLDQLTVSELKEIAGNGTFHVVATSSINLPYIYETDGPTAVNSFFTGKYGTAFPAPIMVASTWNKELAAAFGTCIGNELCDFGFTGWYGPGMNIHRNAFSGRNFEYYSEDGYLSGCVAAAEVKAVRELGIIPYMKHFALNDSETDRARGICTWSTEQAIREVYLKPFEMAIKEGGANGIMNSKNSIGSRWIGSNADVQNTIVRGEWGFKGIIGTDSLDAVSEYYENQNEALRAGTDKMLCMSYSDDYWADESAGTVTALRTAAHHILYALANSNAMEVHTGLPVWVYKFIGADAVIVILLALWEVFTIREYRNKKKEEQ